MTNKKTVSFKTFGCKQNQYDTDFLKQVFREKGYEICESGPADIFVINTCTVTSRSAAKCRQAIRAAARSGAKVVVTGCYPQVAKDELWSATSQDLTESLNPLRNGPEFVSYLPSRI